jgi:putative N6-adenine-specific DNA methylase
MIFNPPYGERLTLDTNEFYGKIGDTLKHNYPNSTAWLITSDIQALKNVGLRTSKRIPLKNGDLDCRYVKYELYEGSRKFKKNQQDYPAADSISGDTIVEGITNEKKISEENSTKE